MATRGAIAEMEDLARKRIDAASAVLAERHKLDVPVVPFEKKADMRMLRHLETQAAFLEAMAGTAKSQPAEPLADLADDAAAEGVTLDVEETKDGTPVVVTEAVEPEPEILEVPIVEVESPL